MYTGPPSWEGLFAGSDKRRAFQGKWTRSETSRKPQGTGRDPQPAGEGKGGL